MINKNNNKQKVFISIITVVYNGAKTLEQTIQSVTNQTYRNIEYIIIDGGSTDGTLDIIKKYEDQISLWVSEPDKGLYDAMNKGIRMASGELIGMINSDDWYELNAVETVVNSYLNNLDKRIFHGNTYYIKDNLKSLRKFNPSNFKFQYYGMTYAHPSTFIHKEIYGSRLYDLNFRTIADTHFFLYNFRHKPNVFHHISAPVANFRIGGISSSLSLREYLTQSIKARKSVGFSLVEIGLFVCVYTTIHFINKIRL
jgi:glycosyltransferase involved in cell wall biosynthesis